MSGMEVESEAEKEARLARERKEREAKANKNGGEGKEDDTVTTNINNNNSNNNKNDNDNSRRDTGKDGMSDLESQLMDGLLPPKGDITGRKRTMTEMEQDIHTLSQRYFKGEISEENYITILKTLRGGNGNDGSMTSKGSKSKRGGNKRSSAVCNVYFILSFFFFFLCMCGCACVLVCFVFSFFPFLVCINYALLRTFL